MEERFLRGLNGHVAPWEGAEEFCIYRERNTFHSRRGGRITRLSVHGGGNYLVEKEGKVVL